MAPPFGSIALCKSISRHPFRRPSNPITQFVFKILIPTSNQILPDTHSDGNNNNFFSPISKFDRYLRPRNSNTSIYFPNEAKVRPFCSGGGGELDYDKEVDEINVKFAEAREEIEMALESKETVYFDDEAECANKAVRVVFDMYDRLMAKLPDSEKGALQRSMGLKIEQLKAEIGQLND